MDSNSPDKPSPVLSPKDMDLGASLPVSPRLESDANSSSQSVNESLSSYPPEELTAVNANSISARTSKSLPCSSAQRRGGQRRGVKRPKNSPSTLEQKKSKISGDKQQPKKKRLTRCPPKEAHLCEVCSLQDCNECLNCK